MAGFSIKQNQDTYNFDLTGSATLNGDAISNWTTNQQNQIVVTKKDNTTAAFDVGWSFDTNNHLILSFGGASVFDFNNDSNVTPFYATKDAVLLVRPDEGNLFTFELRGDWQVSNEHLLSITINGAASVIDGFFFDPRSRFMYHFADKKNPLQASVLGFVGTWESFNDDGKPRVKFIYQMEPGADNKPRTGVFVLPSNVIINRSNNQLVYQYDKDGHTRQIQFIGTLAISPDFVITYALNRQTTGSGEQQVGSTTFTFGAVINKKNFTGDLQLMVAKNDGSPGTALSIRGSFRAVRGATSLQVGFSFDQTRGTDKVTTTFGFAGVLKFKDNNTISWVFASNSVTKEITLAINAEIRLGRANIDQSLNLKMQNGQVVGVKFLLGVSF
jgi:hypothetical protein